MSASFLRLQRQIPLQEVITLLRNIGVNVAAGVSLTEGLEMLQQETSRRQRRVVGYLRERIEKGMTLAQAMATCPESFPPIVVSLVRAGAQSGNLEKNIQEAANYLRKGRDIKRSIRSAMMYPIFVFATMVVVGIAVGVYVLPGIIPLFQSLDVDLPPSTKILLFLANFFKEFGLHVVLALLAFLLILTISYRFAAFRYTLQRLLLRLPYFGKLQKVSAVSQISSTLATILSSGIPLSSALPICADAMQSLPYKYLLLNILPKIEKGSTLFQAAEKSPLVPGMAKGFIRMGEKTGTLAKGLRYLSKFYEEEVRYAAKSLSTILEPIMLIVVGLIVAAMAMAIITPIYRVTGSIG